MGGTVTGRYKVEYLVEDLTQKLAKNTRLLQQQQALTATAMGVDPAKARQSNQAMYAQYQAMQRLGRAFDQHGRRLRDTSGAIDRHTTSVGKSTQQFQYWGLALRRMMLWWGSAALMIGAQKVVRSTLEIAGAFQYLVRELTVIGSEGEAVYRRLAASGYQAAVMTGRAFGEAAEAMKAWVRQGYSSSEVAELTRTTLIGLNLTEMSSIELVRTMTATMKAFDIPAEESIRIIDKLVGVSRRFAIETGQLATGIRRFAASAEVANVTLEQQMGIMTAMMVGTQQSAQMVGRAGRTITTRMRRNAVEALETIAKVEVYTDKSRQTYRALWDVLSDLAATWGQLTDVQKEEIAFQAAGLRQREFFLALMRDFDVAQKAHIEALASAGLAYKANIILVDSYQKAIAALRAEWERMLAAQSGLLDFFTNVVNGLRAMVRQLTAIPEAAYVAISAILALGGAAFNFFGMPLIGIPMMGAGLLGLGAWELGKTTRDLDSLVQKYKQVVEGQYQAADSTEKLAKEFINLFEQQEKGKENTEALVLARKRLHELNPLLVSEEESFASIYGVLTGRLNDLTAATREAYKARQEFLLAQKESQVVTAQERLREKREQLPEDLRLMPFAQREEEYRKLFAEQSKLMTASMRMSEQVAEARRQAEQATYKERDATQEAYGAKVDEQALLEKKIEANKELLTQLSQYILLEKDLAALQKELEILRYGRRDVMGPPTPAAQVKPEFNAEKYKEQQKQISQELALQETLVEQQLAYVAALEGKERSRAEQAVEMYKATYNWLWAQYESAETLERQVAILDEIIARGPKSLKWHQMILEVIKGFVRGENAAYEAVRKRMQADEEAHEKSRRGLEERMRLQNAWDRESGERIESAFRRREEIRAAEMRSQSALMAERIRLTEGAVAAARYEYDEAKKNFDLIDSLRKTEETREWLKEAYITLLEKETALDLAILRAELDIKAAVEERQDAEFNQQVRLTRMREGEIAAAEMVLRKRVEEAAILEMDYIGRPGERTEEKRLALIEAQKAARKAQGDVDAARLAKQIDLEDEYTRIKEEERKIENQTKYDAIEAQKGRAAAIQAEIQDIAMEITLLEYGNVTEQESLKILDLKNQKRAKEGEWIKANAEAEEAALQMRMQLIQQIGQFIEAEIRGQTAGGRISGIGGLVSIGLGMAGVPGGIVLAVNALSGILGALADREEENTESLDLNTLALDRNTETLNDIRQAVIGGIAGRFIWPAAVEHYGYPSLQGGGMVVREGLAVVHPGEVSGGVRVGSLTIVIPEALSARQLVNDMEREIRDRWQVDERRGFGPRTYDMPR